jgi:hypothetical protein
MPTQTERTYPTSKQAINTSVSKGTCTVDEISSGMDDGCNELGSCYGSAIEYSDNSDSEHEIFRVKRRSTTIGKPAADSRLSKLSEQQVHNIIL